MELIDRDALWDKVFSYQFGWSNEDVVSELKTFQIIDPVHAAGSCYCRECKYRFTDNCSTYYESSQGQFQHIIEDDGFCSYGERRVNEID